MAGERTRAINSLTALLRTVDLGMDARKPLTAAQLTTIAGWRDREETWPGAPAGPRLYASPAGSRPSASTWPRTSAASPS